MVHFYQRIYVFLIGVTLGLFIGRLCIYTKNPSFTSYNIWFENQKLRRKNFSWDTLRYKKLQDNKFVIESEFLFRKVNVLCIILLKNKKYTKPLKETWTKGCNELQFINIEKNKSIPIKRDLKDSSWVRLCQTLQNVEKFDWLLITKDLTFVLMENLRYILAPLSPQDNYYLGHTLEFWKTLYNSIDAGVVLSKATLNVFREAVTEKDCLSSHFWNREDYYLGKTLATVNITPSDIRDDKDLTLFYPHNLNSLIFYEDNHYKSSKHLVKCCSKHLISFQAIDGDKMYTYYFLLYMLQLFNEGYHGNIPNKQENDNQVWKNFLKRRNITNDEITSAEYYKIWENLIDDPTSFAANMKRDIDEHEL